MSHFEYTAQCKGGAAISGTLESADSVAATEQLIAMGLCNIDLRTANRPPLRRPLGSDDFIFFNEQLAALANAGICLDEGLRQLGKDVHSGRLRTVLEAMANDIERGQSLDEALERHAAQMPVLYSRVVRAGVKNGHLPATLLNLSHHLRLVAETKRLLAEALTYPAIVLILAIGVFCALLMFVVPHFAETFEDFGVRLPTLTVMMIAFSQVLPRLLIGGGVILLGVSLLLSVLRLSNGGRLWRERMILRVPILGSLIRNSLQARFLRAMAFAVDTAVPLPEAMRLSAGATGSPTLAGEAQRVALQVEQGVNLEDACRQTSLIPAMFGYFAGVKSDVGSLRDGLIQLSRACESRASHSQAMLRAWIAPLAVVVVGLAIGLLILALFMPLVQLIQCVSGG
jgi:type II secretory pathway component PulF